MNDKVFFLSDRATCLLWFVRKAFRKIFLPRWRENDVFGIRHVKLTVHLLDIVRVLELLELRQEGLGRLRVHPSPSQLGSEDVQHPGRLGKLLIQAAVRDAELLGSILEDEVGS